MPLELSHTRVVNQRYHPFLRAASPPKRTKRVHAPDPSTTFYQTDDTILFIDNGVGLNHHHSPSAESDLKCLADRSREVYEEIDIEQQEVEMPGRFIKQAKEDDRDDLSTG